jgi:hypothetical protein
MFPVPVIRSGEFAFAGTSLHGKFSGEFRVPISGNMFSFFTLNFVGANPTIGSHPGCRRIIDSF